MTLAFESIQFLLNNEFISYQYRDASISSHMKIVLELLEIQT